jgi:hypothetical protein
MTSKDGPTMEGPAAAAAGAGDTNAAPQRKRAREEEKEAAEEASKRQNSSAAYVTSLRGEIEEFLLKLVIQVVRDSKSRAAAAVSEQDAADMVKYLVRDLLESD